MRVLGSGLAAAVLACAAAGRAQQSPPAAQPVIRAGAQEVLLDMIVRDKKGRAVRDLQPGEIEVYDEGARQTLTGFRMVNPGDQTGLGSAAVPGGAPRPYDPLRQLRLVSLVFESLDNEARRLVRQAALEFLKNPLEQNVYMGVFVIDQRLYVLQQFTNDRERLRKAIERATTQQYTEFAAQSDAIRAELEQVEKQAATAGAGPAPGRGNPGGDFSGAAAAHMAQMTLNILRYEETATRDQQARSAIFSLFSVVREQFGLPGRKTLVYFSEGLTVPEAVIEPFQSLIAMANRAGVSVYGVDARGLTSEAMNASSLSMLQSAAASSARQQSVSGEAVTADQAKVFDTLRDSIHANRQQALEALSNSTGGFLIANTNDYRVPFRRLAEDIGTYYELAYVPPVTEYDGRFRRISVKVGRPDVRIQTRSGYFALPPNAGTLFSYEIPLLHALEAAPLARSFPYLAAAVRFEPRPDDKVEYALVLEIPMRDIAFTENQELNQFRAHLALMAVVKNQTGEVVQRFSRDVPITAPASQLEGFRRGHFTQTYHLPLAAGRYVLETAVLDREAMKASAKRAAVVVPASRTGVRISSLTLVRRIEPDSGLTDTADPFHIQGGKIVPTLDHTLAAAASGNLSYYFVVYPEAGSAEKPQLLLEVLRDGQLVAKATPELPAPDGNGLIRYVASLPLSNFPPAAYEIRAVVRQGTSGAEERSAISVNP